MQLTEICFNNKEKQICDELEFYIYRSCVIVAMFRILQKCAAEVSYVRFFLHINRKDTVPKSLVDE